MPGLCGFGPLVGLNDPRFGPRFVSVHDAYDMELRQVLKINYYNAIGGWLLLKIGRCLRFSPQLDGLNFTLLYLSPKQRTAYTVQMFHNTLIKTLTEKQYLTSD